MPYIHFTEEQKLRASEVDLVEFLRHQGEKLIRSGPEYRLASDHSVTVRGNGWYDHAVKEGGGPISFVQQFYNLSYPEAITCLLGGEQGTVYASAPKQEERPKKEFALPSAGQEMRRMYAYLLKHRFLDRNVVNAFVRAGLLYESCEKFKDREYHNAVFVGKDENGVPRHAHKRSLNRCLRRRNQYEESITTFITIPPPLTAPINTGTSSAPAVPWGGCPTPSVWKTASLW